MGEGEGVGMGMDHKGAIKSPSWTNFREVRERDLMCKVSGQVQQCLDVWQEPHTGVFQKLQRTFQGRQPDIQEGIQHS